MNSIFELQKFLLRKVCIPPSKKQYLLGKGCILASKENYFLLHSSILVHLLPTKRIIIVPQLDGERNVVSLSSTSPIFPFFSPTSYVVPSGLDHLWRLPLLPPWATRAHCACVDDGRVVTKERKDVVKGFRIAVKIEFCV